MKKVVIIAILVIAVFLVGCAKQEIGVAGEKESTDAPVKTAAQTTAKTAPEEVAKEAAEGETAEEHITVKTDEGDDVTFKKLPDYRRERDMTEVCDMDYPLKCSKFLAKDGVEYISIKNAGYSSKIDQVVLRLNGEACDPKDSYIEPGQLKEFECYADAEDDGYVRGDFEMEYYAPIGQKDFLKTGSLVVLME